MFPLNDFNLVCCAVATVSVAVGYRYSRHLERLPRISRAFDFQLHSRKQRRDSTASIVSRDTSITSDSEFPDLAIVDYPTPPPEESISDITEPGSLKRKNRDEPDIDNSPDDGQVEAGPPRKRRRTPSVEDAQTDEPMMNVSEEPIGVVMDAVTEPVAMNEEPSREKGEEDLAGPPAPAADPQPISKPLSMESPTLTKSAFTIPACKPSSAFSAFAGTSSGFAFQTSLSGAQKPVWCSGNTFGSAIMSDVQTQETEIVSQTSDVVMSSTPAPESQDPLAAQSYAKSTHVGITGEEDEEVKSEIKGLKLFVKRGNKEFTTGMLGHLKHLSHKETSEQRLVFRREPVWKVSMSVMLKPSTRCAFDEDQGILRITHMETIEGNKGSEIVVYALKRGKIPKADFASFAQEIVDAGSRQPSSELKSLV